VNYNWYDNVQAGSSIEQGDIIENCNILIPNEQHYEAILESRENNNPIEAIIKVKPHKRLLPPYREHLSQSFARYFMRVGLPVDIPKDEIKNYS
jgi:hypothetical protein